MGVTSERLQRRLRLNRAHARHHSTDKICRAELNQQMPSLEQLVGHGMDVSYAVYVTVNALVCGMLERLSDVPELKGYIRCIRHGETYLQTDDAFLKAQVLHYGMTWAYYDLRLEGGDTIGSTLLDARDLLKVPEPWFEVLAALSNSRMGIYEHLGCSRNGVRLRELISDQEYLVDSSTNFRGRKGQLWYARLLPPVDPGLPQRHLSFTVPYVLRKSSTAAWRKFLRAGMQHIGGADERAALEAFMKYGLDDYYWLRFGFGAIESCGDGVVFLQGFPVLDEGPP